MMNFTTEDLLLFLYGEMDSLQKDALLNELQTNWMLSEKLRVITEAKNRLCNMPLQSPRDKTITRLMLYAMDSAEVNLH